MKFRFVLLLILLVLFTILVIQNSADTLFKVFFWQFSTALSLLIVITGVLGIILGIVIDKILDSRKTKKVIKTKKEGSNGEINQDNSDFKSNKFGKTKK